MFARIVVDLHHQKVDHIYTYRLREDTLEKAGIGCMIRVPFGRKYEAGYIVDLAEETKAIDGMFDGFPVSKIREAGELLSETPVFTKEDLSTAMEMKRRYMAPLSACLALFIPKIQDAKLMKEKTKETVCLLRHAGTEKKLGKSQRSFLEALEKMGENADLSDLRKDCPITRESLSSLVKQAYICIKEESEGKPPADFVSERTVPLTLNDCQKQAFDKVAEAIENESSQGFLLHGITGSGKTEVYMQCIQKALDMGKQAILLVPEIALTPQLIDVFRKRFGSEVGVTHSRLTDRERTDLWYHARNGVYKVMIGPRSCLFTPFRNLGLIILDEEHEASYRSEQMAPHYHAREVAMIRAEAMHCPVILGSATPSVESYFKAVNTDAEETLELLELPERAVKSASLPDCEIVDMRMELALGNTSMFSDHLAEKIRDRLEKKEQTILFLNRKGYSTSVNCRKCGFVLKCPHCEMPYTYHKSQGKLICHHCGKMVDMPPACPSCGSRFLKQFGVGTEKVEEAARLMFPEARVIRMDMNTMRSRDDYEALYKAFRDGEGDILIGTQMVAKGFDFPKVTLVGVLAADMTLYDFDFHGVERTFQLLTQVVGRAGRSALKGEALIQTYSPDHYAILAAKDQSYSAFYKEEILARQIANCPPFTHLAQVVIAGKNEDKVKEEIQSLARVMRYYAEGKRITVLGPSPASLEKINDVYRYKVIIKCREEERLRNFILYCTKKWEEETPVHELLTADIDPTQLL